MKKLDTTFVVVHRLAVPLAALIAFVILWIVAGFLVAIGSLLVAFLVHLGIAKKDQIKALSIQIKEFGERKLAEFREEIKHDVERLSTARVNYNNAQAAVKNEKDELKRLQALLKDVTASAIMTLQVDIDQAEFSGIVEQDRFMLAERKEAIETALDVHTARESLAKAKLAVVAARAVVLAALRGFFEDDIEDNDGTSTTVDTNVTRIA